MFGMCGISRRLVSMKKKHQREEYSRCFSGIASTALPDSRSASLAPQGQLEDKQRSSNVGQGMQANDQQQGQAWVECGEVWVGFGKCYVDGIFGYTDKREKQEPRCASSLLGQRNTNNNQVWTRLSLFFSCVRRSSLSLGTPI